nr:nucleoside recognition domain-containing protein [uncultured Butyricicoccus sp.]
MGAWMIPAMLAVIAVTGLVRGVDVFSCFLSGAKKGAQTAATIAPTLVGLLTAVYMLRASGVIDWLGAVMQPFFSMLGIPAECAPLVLLKPISGGGGLALGTDIMQRAGVDSYAGRVAAVMLGASETSIYTISLYAGSLGLRSTRYAVPAALVGDLTAFVSAAFFVRLFFGNG